MRACVSSSDSSKKSATVPLSSVFPCSSKCCLPLGGQQRLWSWRGCSEPGEGGPSPAWPADIITGLGRLWALSGSPTQFCLNCPLVAFDGRTLASLNAGPTWYRQGRRQTDNSRLLKGKQAVCAVELIHGPSQGQEGICMQTNWASLWVLPSSEHLSQLQQKKA